MVHTKLRRYSNPFWKLLCQRTQFSRKVVLKPTRQNSILVKTSRLVFWPLNGVYCLQEANFHSMAWISWMFLMDDLFIFYSATFRARDKQIPRTLQSLTEKISIAQCTKVMLTMKASPIQKERRQKMISLLHNWVHIAKLYDTIPDYMTSLRFFIYFPNAGNDKLLPIRSSNERFPPTSARLAK